MPARSFKDMVLAKCIQRRNEIEDIGDDMPYKLARPFLSKIEQPERLKLIEKNSPHIIPHTGELWKAFIKNELPSVKDQVDLMKDNEVNYHVYKKFVDANAKQVEKDRKELEAKMAALNAKKAGRQSIVINPKKLGLKVPVDRKMRAGYLATERAQMAIQGKSTPSRHAPSAGGKGSSLIAKLQKGGFNKFAMIPTNQVPKRTSVITQVPKTMIKSHPTPTVARPTPPSVARPSMATSSSGGSSQRQTVKRKADDQFKSDNDRLMKKSRTTSIGFGNAKDANQKLDTSPASAKSRDISATAMRKESSIQQGRVQPRGTASASSKATREARPADRPRKPAEPEPKPATKAERVQAEKDEKARRRAAAVAAAAERRRAIMG